MSSQAFFWMNIGCALILALLFLIGRKGVTAPSRLNLRKGEVSSKKLAKGPRDVHFHRATESSTREKSLNVMFMYNGHSFDAYEVIGAPAGASLAMAQKYFNQSLARMGSDRDFLEAAMSAIQQSKHVR